MMGFFGRTLEQSYYANGVKVPSGSFAPVIYTVSAATEFTTNQYFSVDVSDTQIAFDFKTTGFFSFPDAGPSFTDVDGTVDRIIGVTIDSSNVPGFTAANISWDADHIWVDWGALSFSDLTSIVLNVQFFVPPPILSIRFTDQADGTLLSPIDFNYAVDYAYKPTGGIYGAGGGNDVVILPAIQTVDVGNPWSYTRKFDAGAGDDVIQGANGNDQIQGNGGNDWLWGRTGRDDLEGGTGNDVLAGGRGGDTLNGGSGRDIYLFLDNELGTTKTGEHDRIGDFHPGVDKLDLSDLFSDVATFGGVQRGILDGQPGDYFTVAFSYENGRTWVQGDVNGDGYADFTIELANKQSLTVNDLILNETQWLAAVGPNAMFTFEQAHNDSIIQY